VDQCCQCDEGPEGDLSIEHLKVPYNQFYDDDCNYATMEGVEAVCNEHGIAYHKSWSSGGGYGEGEEIFTGTETHQIGTIDGEPAMTLRQIKELGTGFLAYLDMFDWSKYPPVEIVEDDAAQAA
jgi:hypothetical protein